MWLLSAFPDRMKRCCPNRASEPTADGLAAAAASRRCRR
jgi:hypothetical protein